MAKWSDTDAHIYPWKKWTDFTFGKVRKFLVYTVDKANGYGFLLFFCVGIPLVILSRIFFLLTLPLRLLEWSFMNILEPIDRIIHKYDDSPIGGLAVIVGLLVAAPITFSYGIPALIWFMIKKLRKGEPVETSDPIADMLEVINEHRSKTPQDFKPKHILNKHKLNTRRQLPYRPRGVTVMSQGTYTPGRSGPIQLTSDSTVRVPNRMKRRV